MDYRRLTATLNNVGACHARMGRHGDAMEAYQRAVRAAMIKYEEGGGVGAGGLHSHDYSRDLELAESQYEALRMELAEYESDDSRAVEPLDLYELDAGAIQVGMMPKSISLPLRESTDPSLRHLPADLDCRESAITLYNMALVHVQTGNVSVAERLFDMAMAALPSGTFPDVAAQILNCVALVKNFLGSGEDAMDSLSAALDLGRQLVSGNVTSDETEDVMIDAEECYFMTLSIMGQVYYQSGEYERALLTCNDLLEGRRLALGENHIRVVATMYNCGLILYEMGSMDDAIVHVNPLIARIENWQGQDREEVETRQIATALHNVGVILIRNNRVTRSIALLTRALDAWVSAFGPDHIDVAMTSIELGKLKQDMGLYVEASMHFNNALRIHRKELGADSIPVATIQCHLGLLHYSRGELDEAMVVFDSIIRILRSPSARDTDSDLEEFAIKILETMGNILLEKGDLPQAMATFADAARMLTSSSEHGSSPADPSGSLLILPNLFQSMGVRIFPAAAAA